MIKTRTRTHHSSRGAEAALRELITISRAVGADPDLVQGGGGNTSVKTRDGVVMLVKASGTSLADMDHHHGWALLDLAKLRAILRLGGLPALPSARREKRVLELLAGTVIRPAGSRPSVESNLHALLDRVVIHTHPVGLNVLLCSRRSRELALEVVGKPRGEPLYVPYIDPGYTLAARMGIEIARYRKRHGAPPAVVLLENHGLFVAAPEVEECLALSKEITDRGRRFIGGKRVNPRALRAASNGAGGDGRAMDRRSMGIESALLEGGSAPLVVRRDETPLAAEFIDDPRAATDAGRGAFTPDQIVYCRTHPLILAPGEEPSAKAVRSYRSKHRLDPRVLVSPGQGVFYAAPDLRQLGIVAEVYRSAMAAILRSTCAGGPRFLTPRQARFIEGWEVEAFRAQLSAGQGKPVGEVLDRKR